MGGGRRVAPEGRPARGEGPHAVAFGLAGLLAVTGDRDGLKALCTRMLDDYGATTEARFANDLARRCAMVPGVVPHPGRLVDLARQAVAAGHPHPQYRFHLRWRMSAPGDSTRPSGRRTPRSRPSPAGIASRWPPSSRPSWPSPTRGSAIPTRPPGNSPPSTAWAGMPSNDGAIPRIGGGADFLTLKREAVATVTGKPAPDDPELHRQRGQAYARLGQSARAAAEFRAAGGP